MIVKMSYSNLNDYNKSNEAFTVIGRIIPKYEDGTWSYNEEIYEDQQSKQYDPETIDTSYIDDKNKAVYFYYDEDNCAGQIRLRTNWNGFGFIEDIGVAKSSRNKGIGTALINKAVKWAKQNGLIGLMLETQDVNLPACRFYAKNNFFIGAVDTMLYSNFPTANEIAIYWYNRFEQVVSKLRG